MSTPASAHLDATQFTSEASCRMRLFGSPWADISSLQPAPNRERRRLTLNDFRFTQYPDATGSEYTAQVASADPRVKNRSRASPTGNCRWRSSRKGRRPFPPEQSDPIVVDLSDSGLRHDSPHTFSERPFSPLPRVQACPNMGSVSLMRRRVLSNVFGKSGPSPMP
jgi:hypothetical protein